MSVRLKKERNKKSKKWIAKYRSKINKNCLNSENVKRIPRTKSVMKSDKKTKINKLQKNPETKQHENSQLYEKTNKNRFKKSTQNEWWTHIQNNFLWRSTQVHHRRLRTWRSTLSTNRQSSFRGTTPMTPAAAETPLTGSHATPAGTPCLTFPRGLLT